MEIRDGQGKWFTNGVSALPITPTFLVLLVEFAGKARSKFHRHVVAEKFSHLFGRLRVRMIRENARSRWCNRCRLNREGKPRRFAKKVRGLRLTNIESELAE